MPTAPSPTVTHLINLDPLEAIDANKQSFSLPEKEKQILTVEEKSSGSEKNRTKERQGGEEKRVWVENFISIAIIAYFDSKLRRVVVVVVDDHMILTYSLITVEIFPLPLLLHLFLLKGFVLFNCFCFLSSFCFDTRQICFFSDI